MNKQYFNEIVAYNLWANEKMAKWLSQINESQWSQPLVSSFTTIKDTVLHNAGAESIWRDRLSGTTDPRWIPETFKGTKQEAIDLWLDCSRNFQQYLAQTSIEELNEDLNFKRLSGEQYLITKYKVIIHVCNHATYHRGQLVTMLRQVGFTMVTSTDISTFYTQKIREK